MKRCDLNFYKKNYDFKQYLNHDLNHDLISILFYSQPWVWSSLPANLRAFRHARRAARTTESSLIYYILIPNMQLRGLLTQTYKKRVNTKLNRDPHQQINDQTNERAGGRVGAVAGAALIVFPGCNRMCSSGTPCVAMRGQAASPTTRRQRWRWHRIWRRARGVGTRSWTSPQSLPNLRSGSTPCLEHRSCRTIFFFFYLTVHCEWQYRFKNATA